MADNEKPTWAAAQVNDLLGVVERHLMAIRAIDERYRGNPEYQAQVKSLGRKWSLERALEWTKGAT